MTFGERLRTARDRKVWTQFDLAAASKVAMVTVSRLENDAKPNPRPSTVRKLAVALDVSPEWLAHGEEGSGPETTAADQV